MRSGDWPDPAPGVQVQLSHGFLTKGRPRSTRKDPKDPSGIGPGSMLALRPVSSEATLSTSTPRIPVSLVASVPTAVALGVLFFLPWTKVSCSSEKVGSRSPYRHYVSTAGPSLPEITMEVGQASGWELARGEFRSDPRLGVQAQIDAHDVPASRPWVYVGVALPALAGLLGMLAAGGVRRAGLSRLIVLIGLGGVGLMVAVSLVDFTDDIISHIQTQAAQQGRAVPPARLSQMEAELPQIIQTAPTPWIWISMGLYSLVAVCGLVALGEAEAPSRYTLVGGGGSAVLEDYDFMKSPPPEWYGPPYVGPAGPVGQRATDRPAFREPGDGPQGPPGFVASGPEETFGQDIN